MSLEKALKAYVEQLTPLEKTVLLIAQGHLETSFSLENSIGFNAWVRSNNVDIIVAEEKLEVDLLEK